VVSGEKKPLSFRPGRTSRIAQTRNSVALHVERKQKNDPTEVDGDSDGWSSDGAEGTVTLNLTVTLPSGSSAEAEAALRLIGMLESAAAASSLLGVTVLEQPTVSVGGSTSTKSSRPRPAVAPSAEDKATAFRPGRGNITQSRDSVAVHMARQEKSSETAGPKKAKHERVRRLERGESLNGELQAAVVAYERESAGDAESTGDGDTGGNGAVPCSAPFNTAPPADPKGRDERSAAARALFERLPRVAPPAKLERAKTVPLPDTAHLPIVPEA
jgi:hypothetical protein